MFDWLYGSRQLGSTSACSFETAIVVCRQPIPSFPRLPSLACQDEALCAEERTLLADRLKTRSFYSSSLLSIRSQALARENVFFKQVFLSGQNRERNSDCSLFCVRWRWDWFVYANAHHLSPLMWSLVSNNVMVESLLKMFVFLKGWSMYLIFRSHL